MAEPFQKDAHQPDISINPGLPGHTTQPRVELEVDVSDLHSPVAIFSLGLSRTSARYTRYRIYLGFFVSPILHLRGFPNSTNLPIKGLEHLVT